MELAASDPLAYTRTLDCVHCGLCLQECPTYRVLGLETESPRGRIHLMRALAEGCVGDPEEVRPHLDRCLGCRACESVCPSGVQYGRILETVRAELQERRPVRGLASRVRRFVLWHVVGRPRRLRFAFSVAALAERLGLRAAAERLGLLPARFTALLPRMPPRAERRPLQGSWAAYDRARGRVQFFSGCVMEQAFGRVNRATVELLRHNGFDVEVPAAQVCCGALLLHDGHAALARRLAAANVSAFEEALGKRDPTPLISNSAGCGAVLKGYGELLGTEAAHAFAARCRDVTEFLTERGLTRAPAPFPHRVAYDDPCHLCHAQGVREQPRALLRQMPALQPVEHRDPEACCGSAGIYNLVHPELAAPIGRRKARALIDSGAEVVATGNPGCMLQIAAHLRALGSSAPVVHPVELLLPER